MIFMFPMISWCVRACWLDVHHCCITAASLLHHCCITAASLLHHCCITAASLMHLCCSTPHAAAVAVRLKPILACDGGQ